jgi:tetratricopeptide (TPR) repeat protein|tara:strand:+ start:564 stop:1658 length:1095 start_codon:yes stop_codon:yes gene_type:complete
MDIDEFLEREIQPKDTKQHPVTGSAKGEIDSIKHYFELWDKVSDSKFKWDSGLYTELNKARNEVKAELDRLTSTTEKDKNAIKHLIVKAQSELKNKDHEAATHSYSEISDIQNKFPKFLLEEKKELNKEIFKLYEKLHDQIDSKFINDFRESIAKVQDIIREAFSNLERSDIKNAKNLYEKALEAYKDLADGFLTEKLELGNQLLSLYKELSIHTQIKDLQQQLDKRLIRSCQHTSIGGDKRLLRSYQHTGTDSLKHLSQIAKNNKETKERISTLSKLSAISSKKAEAHEKSSVFSKLSDISQKKRIHSETLLPRLISRKLDRAKTSLKRGLYLEAKKNINAILKVDPDNLEAKQLLDEVPVEV